MKIDILTLFPEMIEQALLFSIPKRAQEKGLLEVKAHQIRDWAIDKRGTVDDTPYGGGPGMILRVDVVDKALRKIDPRHKSWRIMLTPKGRQMDQKIIQQLLSKKNLVLLSGRYEGFDERISSFVDEQLSIGPYVLSGGEIAALALIDSIARLIPGVLGNIKSLENETFTADEAEHPQYTRPEVYKSMKVPPVLLSGNHQEIEKWRRLRQKKIN